MATLLLGVILIGSLAVNTITLVYERHTSKEVLTSFGRDK